MKKTLSISVLLALLCSSVCAHAAIIEAESEVVAVTVYTTSAQITREASVKVEKGHNEIIFIYEIKGVDQSFIDDKIIAESKTKTISGLRTQKGVEKFFKRNINFTFIYLDEEKNELMNITITRNDLGY